MIYFFCFYRFVDANNDLCAALQLRSDSSALLDGGDGFVTKARLKNFDGD